MYYPKRTGLISRTVRKTVTPIKVHNSLPSFRSWTCVQTETRDQKCGQVPREKDLTLWQEWTVIVAPILPQRDLNMYMDDRTLGKGNVRRWRNLRVSSKLGRHFETKTWRSQLHIVHTEFYSGWLMDRGSGWWWSEAKQLFSAKLRFNSWIL